MKLFFLMLFACCNLLVHGNIEKEPCADVESVQSISTTYYAHQWVICLNDKTLWEAYPLKEKRSQTWDEWWNSISPPEWSLDESFFVSPLNWKEHQNVQISNAPDELFKGFTFILHNLSLNEKAFAKPISTDDLILPKLSYVEKVFTHFEGEGSLEDNNRHIDVLIFRNQVWQTFPVEKNYFYAGIWEGRSLDYYDQPDESFLFDISDWKKGDLIKMYSNKDGEEGFFSKKYLLENRSKNQLLFAAPISTRRFSHLYQKYSEKQAARQYEIGFNKGYYEAYSKKNNDIYIEGYREGYEKGHNEGFRKGYKEGQLTGGTGATGPQGGTGATGLQGCTGAAGPY